MTQPYKTCPQCGQPAVLEMPQCRRCGFLYPPVPSRAPISPPRPVERSRAERNRLRNRALLGTLLGLLLLASITFGLVRWLSHPLPTPADSLTLAPHRAAPLRPPALPTAPTMDIPESAPLSQPGMFLERDSSRDVPRLYITNLEDDIMTLTLQDAQGHIYQAVSSHGSTVLLDVPAGDYQLRIVSNDPGMGTTYGDAVFRRRKEYEARLLHGHHLGPLHLGDP